MMIRIATLALSLAVLTACERQPQEPPRTPPPATGETGQAGQTGQTTEQTRQAEQARQADQARQTEQARQADQTTREADRSPRTGMDQDGRAMTEEQRQAALRACERLQGEDRELCERDVREVLDPDEARRDGQR